MTSSKPNRNPLIPRLIILFIPLLIVFALPGVAPVSGDAGGTPPHVTISTNKTIFKPGDTMRISFGITTAPGETAIADLSVVLQDPNGVFSTIYNRPNWSVTGMPLHEVASISMEKKLIGPYTWFAVLTPPGSALMNIQDWIASAGVELFLLPNTPASTTQIAPTLSSWKGPPRLIAHAGGAFKGQTGLNAREALNANYNRGHRYFELDFCRTRDDQLVLIHDWETTFTRLFENADERPTLTEFTAMRMKHDMTQMTLASLLDWLTKHPDALVITDVKEGNPQALSTISKEAGGLRNRFIPQIYHPSELPLARNLGFQNVIFTLYRSVLTDDGIIRFVKNNKLFALTMSVRRAFSFNRLQELIQTGIPVYVHTVNPVKIFNYFLGCGFHGIYTDHISPDVLQEKTLSQARPLDAARL